MCGRMKKAYSVYHSRRGGRKIAADRAGARPGAAVAPVRKPLTGILIHKFYVDVDREYQEHCVSGFLLEQYSARINLDRYTLNAQTTNL